MSKRKFQILDCTIRDGGYVNDWQFDSKLVRESYRTLSKSGVDYVELGFRSSSKHFDPKKYGEWRFCTEEKLQEITKGIKGAKIGVMGDFGKFDLEDLDQKANSCVDIVRLAAHKHKLMEAIDFLQKVKEKGYVVSLQCMGYSKFTEEETAGLVERLKDSDIDYVYVADSYGSIFPFQMEAFFRPLLELERIKVGFHPHNNIQMAFANTLEAIRLGVHIIDTSIYGIGRGAGNLPTEILLSYLIKQGEDRYNAIPVLNCIDQFFIDLNKTTPWGYQLPYMISGIFDSHPNYAKELLRRKEYDIEEIWKAMEGVNEIDAIGFNVDLLDNLENYGLIKGKKVDVYVRQKSGQKDQIKDSIRYADRHENREFLVLANGPNLKKYKPQIDQFIKKHDPVILGANFLNSLFVPHYHAFNNKKRFKSHINSVNDQSDLLLGTNFSEELIGDYVTREYERLGFINKLDADFDIQNGVITSNCRTISVLLIGVAIVMGANRVFVAGMDGYLSKDSIGSTLFYNEKFEPEEHQLNVDRHEWNDRFLKQIDQYLQQRGGEGVHILTPTGYSSFYKGIEIYI